MVVMDRRGYLSITQAFLKKRLLIALSGVTSIIAFGYISLAYLTKTKFNLTASVEGFVLAV